MATPDRSEEAPPQKKSRFSLGKCPNPSAAQKCSPNFARMVPAALATPLPPPEAIRARFETAGLPWMGIDIETHRLVPSTADSWWRPGQFGFMTRLTKEVLAELRVVQIGWTIGTFDAAPTTKERLVRPDGFEISDAATEKHGISHSVSVSRGEPLVKCLRELLDDITSLKLQGGRVCSHNLEFDAGILVQEMNRCGLADLAMLLTEAVEGGFCSMDPDVGHWVRRQAGLMDHERKTPMRLRDMVHLLLPEAKDLLERHHSAGNDSHIHWLLGQKIEQACRG
jgi:DNA polymerase III epsilon subunit-like protein